MRNMRLGAGIIVLWMAALWPCCPAQGEGISLTAGSLRCEFLDNPLGIDVLRPRLSWVLQSEQRGQKQTAYQILVATSAESLAQDRADLWDSGKVASDQTIHVEYGGKPLTSGLRAFWKVRVWDREGRPSAWSRPATWSMGLLKTEDWQGRWITSTVKTGAALSGVGYHAAEAAGEDETKWVQVDLGRATRIDAINLHPMRHQVGDRSVKGFGFPVRFSIDVSEDADFVTSTRIAEHTQADYANPGHAVVAFDARGVTGRYVRITASKLWNRNAGGRPYCFALAEVEVLSAGRNAAMNASVAAKDSVEQWGWGKVNLTDGRGLVNSENTEEYAAILLRKEFKAEREVRRATAYICGLGHYELRLNGEKVGNRELDPGWTNYRKTCLYTTYDVTDRVRQGGNALGIMLGNGMYNVPGGRYVKFTGSFGPPKAILRLEIEYADGTVDRVTTDASWKVSASPITFTCIYGGEDYDARAEQPGWDRFGFAENARWKPVLVADGPGGQLKAQMAEPLRVMKTLIPTQPARMVDRSYVYDLGQNFSGWVRLVVKGPAGATVRMIPGERLVNGRADQSTSGSPCYFAYTLKGKGSEEWRPRFSYSGFRYVQVEGAVPAGAPNPSGLPVIEQLQGEVLYPDFRLAGEFACSKPLFNRIHDLIGWAIVSNLKSVITDCPHREKLGWLEQFHLMGPSIMFNHDVNAIYAKMANDMAEAQLPNGLVPDIAPEYPVFDGGFRDSPEWGSACCLAPWYAYQRYGDLRILRDHYEEMKRYVEYLAGRSKGHILSHGLGDWYDIGPREPGVAQNTPLGVTATAIYYQDVTVLQKVADLLGKADEAARFKQQAEQIKTAFNKQFFNSQTNQYATGSQTSNAMTLVLGLVEADRAGAVLENLVQDIRGRGNHTMAGDVGYRYVLRALAGAGRSDVIFDMAARKEHPSYGYQLEHGATSLTEAWDGPTRGYSQNHMMLGHIEEWFYQDLAGIRIDLARSEAERIWIKPQVVGDVTWAKASYNSVYGRIASHWTLENGRFTLTVTIPPNCTATVYVPTRNGAAVTESGRPVDQVEGVKLFRVEGGAAVCHVASGTYRFVSRLAVP